MARKLKVYRTPIGFHDAYVAATSQKAALKAWGADVDLFARGVAEAVTDETLIAEPLEKPGTIVRRPRGTSEEHMAALPEDEPKRRRRSTPREGDDGPPPRRGRGTSDATVRPRAARRTPKSKDEGSAPSASKVRPRPAPRPSRARLDQAEHALDRSRTDHEQAIAEIRQQERNLQQRRGDIEARREKDLKKQEAAVAKARASYGAALEKWRA